MRNRRPPTPGYRGRGPQGQKSASEAPWYAQIADWAVQNVVLGIVATLLSTAIIGGGAYLLYDRQSALDDIDPVLQELANRGDELMRGTEMTSVYNRGWNSDKRNMAHASELLKTLVARKKANQALDDSFAGPAIDWCTSAITQLESERAKIQTYIIHDEFSVKDQSILVSEYAATIKLIAAIREMMIAWSRETAEKRDVRLQTVENEARDASNAESQLMAMAAQWHSYWDSKLREDQIKKDHARHRLHEIGIKTDLAFVGIFIGILLFVPSIAIVIVRFRIRR